MWDDHWEKFGRQQIKGNWGSIVTEGIRVSLPVDWRVGFWWQNLEKNILGGKVGLKRISGWIGEARLYDHLHIPKSERTSNIIEKKTGVKSRRGKKTRSENHGVTDLPP